jgi:serine/threonine protein kinase/WD40 repeat protein
MAGSTITVPVAQFAQQLRQKHPQYSSVPDDKLVAAFVAKNPQFTANYDDTALISVSYEPATAPASAQKPGVTDLVPPPRASEAGTGTVVNPAGSSVSTSGAGAAAQPAPVPVSPDTPYLGNTVIVNVPAVGAPLMVGKYQVVDELGRGGMGIVYKAFDPGIGRTVALKLMSEQLARDTEFRERFQREARGAGILQHTNIVTVHELGEWQGAPFIAMEFLQGRSLEDILKNEKSMPLEKRLDIVAQVCRGLDYAHARGIVHRDIKPANVMVTTDCVAKVVDFGIARLADQKLTNTGHVLGTVSYMSPEQLQGKALDGRSDIFAVGVMLFEALTSVLPFAAEDTGAAITNTLYRQPPSLSNFLANYPKDLDEIIAKCLAKEPAERFQTAGELADRLSQVRQELKRSQVAPTIIRPTPQLGKASSLQTPPVTPAVQELSQTALQSLDAAKEWWKVASPGRRRNAITIAVPILLYLQSLVAPGGGFSDSAMGGGFVTSSTIVLPVAVLSAIVIGIQLWGQRWKESPPNTKLFTGAVGFIVAAFCADKIALGLMWYIIFSKIFLVVVVTLLGVFASTSMRFFRDLWRRGSTKERSLSALGLVLIAGYFLVVFSLNFASYAKNWRASSGERSGELAAGQKESSKAQKVTSTEPKELKLELVRTLVGYPGPDVKTEYYVRSVSFSPDGNLIATTDYHSIRVWDVASGTLLRTIDGGFGGASFSPDGRWLVAGGTVWDVNTGKKLREFPGGERFAMSLEGESWHYIATTRYNIVSIWNMDTGALVREFDAQGGVQSLAFVPGKFGLPDNYASYALPVVIATGMEDGTLKFWNARTGKLMNTLSGHEQKVTGILYSVTNWSSNGTGAYENLLTLDEQGTIRDWHFNQSKVEVTRIAQIPSLGSRTEIVYGALAFIPNDTVVFGTGDGRVMLNNLSPGARSSFLSAHTKAVNTVAISPNGAFLATGSDNKTVKIWKLRDSNGNPAGALNSTSDSGPPPRS